MTDKTEHQPEPLIHLIVFRTEDDSQLQINVNYDHEASNEDYLNAIRLISKTLQGMLGGTDGQQTH